MSERPTRRFSGAISEGDGISILVEVGDPPGAQAAEQQGADGLVMDSPGDVRDATELPLLVRTHDAGAAERAGADACLLVVATFNEWDRVADEHERAHELGLDCVLEVRNEEELEEALEHVDPAILMLGGTADGDGEQLDHVLELLPDVPAGKLAIAHLPAATRDDVEALERAGMDGVVVATRDVASLVSAEPPEV